MTLPRQYEQKSEARLVLEDNIDHIRAQTGWVTRKIKRRLENVSRAEMEQLFFDALSRGEILEYGASSEEVIQLVAKVVYQIALEAGDEGTESKVS